MRTRDKGQPQVPRSVLGRAYGVRQPGARRRLWTRSIALVLPLVLVLVAFLAPTGQARPARQSSPHRIARAAATKAQLEAEKAAKKAQLEAERAAKKAQLEAERAAKKAQLEAERAAKKAQLEAERAAKKAQLEAKKWPPEVSHELNHGVVRITCTQVSWTFRNYPEATKVTIAETLTVAGSKLAPTTFGFGGPTGSHTTAIEAPPGHDTIRAVEKWKRNRAHGVFAYAGRVNCASAPAFSVEKLQEIAGGGGSYTTSPLTGQVGRTVDYEILVKNTGNVPLTLGSFTDPRCDAGTVSGGPGVGALAPESSTSYLCTHLLDEADQSAGSYANTVTVTGTPPNGEGSPVTHTSNTVVVKVPRPAFSVEKLQEIAGGGGSYTTSPLTGQVGQTVDYEILVKNTGNVPLTLGSFTDPRCDAGTVSGGPGVGALAPESSTSYLCTHLLDKADQSAGSYANTVTVTGTPPNGEGSPVTYTSDTVVVNVPTSTTPTSTTPASTTPASTTPASTTSTSTTPPPRSSSPTSSIQPPKSGVLVFKSATVPALKGPQGCVRASFRVSMKSAGVASVTFYLDGRKLKKLTAKKAHKGEFTILIDTAKLGVGAHKLTAKITMLQTASTKVAHASRTVTLLRCRSAVQTPNFAG